ncbi:MAG: hypothetical protein WDM94_14740 [Bauldia sp.]
MNTMRMIFAASAVVAGLATSAALAEPWKGFVGSEDTGDPFTDESGVPIFGFNIAFAGVHAGGGECTYVAGLNAQQKHSVKIGCNQVLRDPAYSQNTTVFDFCRNLRS